MSRKNMTVVGALALAVGLGACGQDGVGVGGTARVRVLLTDAAADYVGAAMVDIGAVQLVPADGSAPVTLSDDGTDGPVDLLTLQGTATQLLADAEIDAGTYDQLRLIVESASVTLADGYEFVGGGTEMPLKVPSGAQTGIKLNLGVADGGEDGDGGLLIAPGETVLVLDFDVSQSFVMQGDAETLAGIKSILFTPTIRVSVEDVAGSVSGAVSTELTDTDVDSLTVTATPQDEGSVEAYQTQTATTMTDLDGNYTIHFLVPGTYSVKVTPWDGLATDPDSTVVTIGSSEDVTDVDFSLVAGS